MNKRWNRHSYAHKLVAELQVAMAHEVYDELAKRDEFYAANPSATAFVNRVAPTLRDAARAELAEMLTRHDVSDHDKNTIYDALLLDKAIPNEDRFHIPPTVH